MEPDGNREPGDAARLELVERAHLKEPGDASHAMFRYPPPASLDAVVARFWIPVWSVPYGQVSAQKVLQHPACLLVVTTDYARFYGVTSGLSTTTLTGDGWAVGVMLTPAAGFLVAGATLAAYADRSVEISDVLGARGQELADRVRSAMARAPLSAHAHTAAMGAYEEALQGVGPIDAEGELVDRVVAFVEDHREVTRVAQVCEEFDLSERALQRLTRRRIGLGPKWLIKRRRLQEVADLVRDGVMAHADVAAVLGYADQAHLVRDFSRVTGTTPGAFAAAHRLPPNGVSRRSP